MRILILTQWYPPEPAILIQELAQTLRMKGHAVTVLTGFPNYPSGRVYPGYRLRMIQKEILSGIPVIRVALYPEHSLSKYRRAFNYLTFALTSSLLGLVFAPKPEIIFVYHPPLTIGLPAFFLSRMWGVPFVYEIQDMWPETLLATGMIKNNILMLFIGRLADWIYRKANTVLVISPGFKRNLVHKGVQPEKIHVISNWVEGEIAEGVMSDEKIAQDLGLEGRFNVLFAGNIGEAQGLETILEAAKCLNDCPDVQFVIVGDGISLPRLKEIAKTQKINNVKFLGRVSLQDMPRLYNLAEVLLVHLKDEPLFRITIPHKIINYLAAGKPILAAIMGDAASVVVDSGAGLVCPPGNPRALEETVRQFFIMSPSDRKAIGARGLCAVKTNYSREAQVAKIEDVLKQALL